MDVPTDQFMASSTASGVSSSPGSTLGGPTRAGGGQAAKIIDRRHPEWRTHQLRWRWLLDSLEGGETYRQAIYGWDLTGLPVRNMIRHPHEYPDPREQNYYGVLGRPPGSDQYTQATNDPYELRRARQPVPTLLRRTLSKHLSKILAEDAERDGPPALRDWWEDVDGSGSPIRCWLKDTILPIGLAQGHIDIILDHPKLPKGVKRASIQTNDDARRYRLDRVIGGYILSENLVWWELDDEGHYESALICEPQEAAGPQYRFWEPEQWTLFDFEGRVMDRDTHPFGRPPIIRLYDKRRPRARNVGLPRYEDVAEIMREIYNRASELILSDTHQVHAIVQAPEDFCQASAEIPMGPNNVLPKKKVVNGPNTVYEPWEVMEFPKGGAEALRQNILDLYDQADEAAHTTKQGAAKNGKNVDQSSGIAKRLDTEDGNQVLGDIAETIARWDRQIAEFYLWVASNGHPSEADVIAVEIRYPKDFDLFSPGERADLIGDYQQSLQGTGATPTADHEMMKGMYRSFLKGLPDEKYQRIDDELEAAIGRNGAVRSAAREAVIADAVGENTAGTASEPDSINSASLASAGVLVTEVY